MNSQIVRVPVGGGHSAPEVVLENFEGYSTETVKSIGEGTHCLALNSSKNLEKKIWVFDTQEKQLKFPIFDPNEEGEPFFGAISRFEIFNQNFIVVLTDSGLVEKIKFDPSDPDSVVAVGNGLVEPYVDDEGEVDFSIALTTTEDQSFTAVASYIRTDANYLCQIVIFDENFELISSKNFIEEKIFQIHNFAVLKKKDQKIFFIGLTNSGDVTAIVFEFDLGSLEIHICEKEELSKDVNEVSHMRKFVDGGLISVDRIGRRLLFSCD